MFKPKKIFGSNAGEILEKAWNYALRALTMRRLTAAELRLKLEQRAVDPGSIGLIVSKLSALRYLDDKEYTRLYVEQALRSGYGKARIKTRLRLKGIDLQLLEDAWAQASPDAEREALQSRAQKLKNQGKSREQSFRHLLRRGYAPGEVNACLRELYDN